MATIKQNNTTQRSAQPKQRTVDTPLQSAAQEIGRTAAGRIVGWLDGLSLRQQEELMEKLAKLVGIDTDKFITLFLDQLKESGE